MDLSSQEIVNQFGGAMVSKNNRAHNKLNRAQERQEELHQVQSRRDEQERRNRVDAFLINAASCVYGSLVAKAWDEDEAVIPSEVLQKAAGIARASIQAFGESFGMLPPISVVPVPTPEPVVAPVVDLSEGKPVTLEIEPSGAGQMLGGVFGVDSTAGHEHNGPS